MNNHKTVNIGSQVEHGTQTNFASPVSSAGAQRDPNFKQRYQLQ